MTLEEAVVAEVRLYESSDKISYETSEKLLAEILKTDEGKEIVNKAEARKNKIC